MRRMFLAFLALAAAAQQPIPIKGTPPELTGGPWINTSERKPIRLAERRGKVTVLHFWTFGCINCKHNLPIYGRWQKRFGERDVAIIGVHSPEFDNERVTRNVERSVRELGIEYPVLVDSGMRNWNRWRQQVWPAVYLIDKRGRLRYRWEGELNWGGLHGEQAIAELIEQLLAETE